MDLFYISEVVDRAHRWSRGRGTTNTDDMNVLNLTTAIKGGSIDHDPTVEKWKMNPVLSNGMPRSGLCLAEFPPQFHSFHPTESLSEMKKA